MITISFISVEIYFYLLFKTYIKLPNGVILLFVVGYQKYDISNQFLFLYVFSITIVVVQLSSSQSSSAYLIK
jgi:hypothetical protein